MEEIRKKDVLRLFFGKEYKHYIVVRVGKHNIKLKNEVGFSVSLPHNDGRLDRLGDADITGFEILRDANRYSKYSVGGEVTVRTDDGKSFQGEILENDDGMLKIKTDAGNEWYVDLDSNDKVELVGNVVLDETGALNLPDEIDDLFFLSLRNDAPRKFERVYELYRTRRNENDPGIPFWVVPVLDPSKCRKDSSCDSMRLLSFTAGKKNNRRLETILFNVTVFEDKVKETFGVTVLPEEHERVPIAEYASIVPLPACSLFNPVNPHYGVRLQNPTLETKRYGTLAEAVEAYEPSFLSAKSAFDAEVLVYPLPLRAKDLGKLPGPEKRTKPKMFEMPPRAQKSSRASLAAAYNGRISETLTPSETLLQMFATDFGNAYFSKKALTRPPHEKGWALESLGQRLKSQPNVHSALANEAVAIVNEMFSLLKCKRYATFLAFVQQYGRVADPSENEDYLYFSTPVFSKYKLVPLVAERLARIAHFRGDSGLYVLLDTLKAENGFLVDSTTGLVVSETKDTLTPNLNLNPNDMKAFLQELPQYSEDDLMLLNLAQRLARELNLRIPLATEEKLLKTVRLDGKDAYKNACTIAAFLAHHGHVTLGVAAEALRKVSKRKQWAVVQDSKELTADVTKAAARLSSQKEKEKEKEKEIENRDNHTDKENRAKKAKQTTNKDTITLSFEHLEPLHPENVRAAPLPILTVLADVAPKEYTYLSDIFAPDMTAQAVLARCMPVVMAVVAPSEQYFIRYLGEKVSNEALYEFVSNVGCIVPTQLMHGHRDFEVNIEPAGRKRNTAFQTRWKQHYSKFLSIDTTTDVSAHFATQYKSKAATFQRLTSAARTAVFKQDREMLEACAVRALYLHLVDEMSEQMEAYVLQMIRACVTMCRDAN